MKFLSLTADGDVIPEYLAGLKTQHARDRAYQAGLATPVLALKQQQLAGN